MKRKIALAMLSGVALSACSQQTIVYQDKERPVSEVEEIISDQLEAENPNLDLEVNISEEVDD